jgi:hypothetical protein
MNSVFYARKAPAVLNRGYLVFGMVDYFCCLAIHFRKVVNGLRWFFAGFQHRVVPFRCSVNPFYRYVDLCHSTVVDFRLIVDAFRHLVNVFRWRKALTFYQNTIKPRCAVAQQGFSVQSKINFS